MCRLSTMLLMITCGACSTISSNQFQFMFIEGQWGVEMGGQSREGGAA